MVEKGFEGECCSDMVEIKEWKKQHEARHVTIDEILNKLLNRLPLWATMLLTIAGGVIGSLLTIIIFLAGELARR